MKNGQLATKVKQLRNQRGLSQELLAEDSGLNLRTIQRIENGESNPTGDTLKRLSMALNVDPADLMDWTIKEDNSYLVFLNLSALSFIFFPLLGILVPFIMWTSKKDKLMHVNKLGRELINFQINWTIVLFVIPLLWLIVSKLEIFGNLTFSSIIMVESIMYAINIILITYNTMRISNKSEVFYFSLIRFLK